MLRSLVSLNPNMIFNEIWTYAYHTRLSMASKKFWSVFFVCKWSDVN